MGMLFHQDGINVGIERGRREGKEEGRQLGIVLIATRMLQNGMRAPEVVKITGLTQAHVKQLQVESKEELM